jgi:hypothetical protein
MAFWRWARKRMAREQREIAQEALQTVDPSKILGMTDAQLNRLIATVTGWKIQVGHNRDAHEVNYSVISPDGMMSYDHSFLYRDEADLAEREILMWLDTPAIDFANEPWAALGLLKLMATNDEEIEYCEEVGVEWDLKRMMWHAWWPAHTKTWGTHTYHHHLPRAISYMFIGWCVENGKIEN